MLTLLLLSAATQISAATVVKLTAAQERAIGLRTAPVTPVQSAPIATLPGVFTPPPNGRSVVVAAFAGSVTEVSVLEGQSVRAGQTLATVFSRDALQESAGLDQARAEAGVAGAAATRLRQLANEGIVAGGRAAEAEARAQAARAMLNAKTVSVGAAGANRSGRYVLRAPFAGRVAHVQISAGEGVEAMAPAFIIDRTERMQVEAVMPASLAGKIAAGAPARVEGVAARVVAVGSAIDPKTRSLSVRAEVAPRTDFIPGRATRLELMSAGATSGFSIPRGAVTTLGSGSVVFARTPGGFTAVPVKVQGWNGDSATVSGALAATSVIAISAVSELKAQALAQ